MINIVVEQKAEITPHLLRLTMAGKGLAEFPADAKGGYIKLLFDNDKTSKPEMRTYTIRDIDHQTCTMAVDFVVHGDKGLASSWAQSCEIGSELTIRGPGPVKQANQQADWFFFVGDLSSLPAISVNLEALQEDAIGHALLLVESDSDIQTLDAPAGIDIEWLVLNNSIENHAKLMKQAVAAKAWLQGECAVWLAGEFEVVKMLKKYFRDDKSVKKLNAYYSSYWKQGLTEPDHKKEKQSL